LLLPRSGAPIGHLSEPGWLGLRLRLPLYFFVQRSQFECPVVSPSLTTRFESGYSPRGRLRSRSPNTLEFSANTLFSLWARLAFWRSLCALPMGERGPFHSAGQPQSWVVAGAKRLGNAGLSTGLAALEVVGHQHGRGTIVF